MPTRVTESWGNNNFCTYSGTIAGYEDFYMNSSDGYANFSNESTLHVGRPSAYYSSIIKISPSAQLPYCDIVEARLFVYCEYNQNGTSTYKTTYLYPVLASWVIDEACWNKRLLTNSWSTGGCRGAGVDYINTLEDSQLCTGGYWTEFDITDVVGSWSNGEIEEKGVVMLGYYSATGTEMRFTSSNGSDGYRPYIEITYDKLYAFEGSVKENSTGVSRKIYAYRRDTGELMSQTTASGSGYFYLPTTYSGSHYLVCVDDDGGVSYNDMIIGNVTPHRLP